jgi:AraC-like DNA-binding protein
MYYERVVDEKSYYLFFYAEYNENTEPHFTPPHCHDAPELLIVTKGSVDGVINGESVVVNAGEMIFLDSYDIHSFTFSDCERYSLVFSKDYCRMLAGDGLTLPTRPLLKGDEFSRIVERLSEYYKAYGEHIPSPLLVESLVSFVLGTVELSVGKVERGERKSELMIDVLEYVRRNSEKELTLPLVAEKFGYAPNYFSTLFNKLIGMSFNDYLNYIRYTRASEIILLQGCSVTDIAMKCGFGSMNTYYRAKNKFDKKP